MRWHTRGLVLGVAYAMLLSLVSCSQHCMMTKNAREVSGAQFLAYYNDDRDKTCHFDYLGRKDDYHYIAVYYIGVGCRCEYQYSIRTPVSELPASFPMTPQKPIRREPHKRLRVATSQHAE